MSVKDDLIGAKGGSGASFRNRPDNLRSTDTFEALIGLCSGRIKGLAPGGLKNLYVDDVPIEDGSGNTTLKDFNAVLFNGDPAILQPITLQLGGSSGAQTVNLPINNPNQDGSPGEWRYATVPQAGVDYIDIRLVVQSLYRQDKNGIYDETASLEVEFQPSGSSQWINPLSTLSAPTYNQNGIKLSTGYSLYALEDNWSNDNTWADPAPGLLRITGKTTQAYVKELRVAVPNTGNYANKTWQIRIRLRERDSYTQDQNQESRAITFESVAGVSMSPIGNREEWRGLAYLQINGKASDQLTGIPTITGVYDFSEVRVPPASVWDAESRVYTGATWDGATEEIKWTQCPAFQMKDLIEDGVSGISALTPGSTLNKWDTLEASKWFAQLVPNGKGGTHPRYSMNYILDSALSVNDLMQYVAGAVGSYAWDEGDGNWRLVVEKPENATALFTKEAIVGEFNYSHTDIDGRLNDIVGVFRNEERGFEEDRVRVFDQAHIDNYGRRGSSIALVGCTNRQEALRRVKIRQLASLKETRQVSFTTNRQGSLVQPFSVILIADGDLASDTSVRTTGRMVSRTETTLNVRDALRLEVGISYKIHVTVPNPDYNPNSTAQPGSPEWRKPTVTISRTITNSASERGDVTAIKIDSALPGNTPLNAQVALEAVGLPTLPKQYRVLDVEPQSEELVAITAIEIYTNKWNESDNVNEDEILAQRPNKVILPPLTPADGKMFSVKSYQAEFQTKRVLTVRWDRPGSIWIDGFKVEYNLNNGPWVTLTEKTQDSYVELQQPQNGDYTFRITTIDRRGGVSQPLVGTYTLSDTAEDYAPTQKIGPLADRPSVGSREGDKYTTNDQNPNLTYIWSNGQWIEESNFVETADQIKYIDPVTGQPTIPVQDLQPAQPGADVTGKNTSKDSNALGGTPAETIKSNIEQNKQNLEAATVKLTSDMTAVREEVQAAANQAKSDAEAARNEAASARSEASTARNEASDARSQAEQVKSDLSVEVDRAKGAEGTLNSKVIQAQGTADSAYSAVSTETTNRANADSALANRINTVESSYGDLSARVTDEATTRANADSAAAARTSAIEARASGAGNLLSNTTFAGNSYAGWTPYGPMYGYSVNEAGDNWHPIGENVLGHYTIGDIGVTGMGSGGGWYSDPVTVNAGRFYQFYAFLASHRAIAVELMIEFLNENNGVIQTLYSGGQQTNTGGRTASNWTQLGWKSVEAPAGAAAVRFTLSKWGTVQGEGNSYLWFWRPYIGEARQGQVEWNPYSPGSGRTGTELALARVADEATTRVNQDSALANRISTTEAQLRGDQDSTLAARVRDEATARANQDGALANRISSTEAKVTQLAEIFRVQSAGNVANNSPFGKSGALYYADGSVAVVGGRSYTVVTFATDSNTIDYANLFDVYGDDNARAQMADKLNSIPSGKTVIIFTVDEPWNGHLGRGLDTAMAAVGAGEAFFSPNFRQWSAYVLVGRGQAGRGNGVEYYAGKYDQDPNAFLDVNIPMLKGRPAVGSNSGAFQIRAALDDEITVRANADGALANRISTVEAQFRGDQDSTIAARIRDEATARANQDGALANRISTTESDYASLNSTVSGALFPGFENTTKSWGYDTAWTGRNNGAYWENGSKGAAIGLQTPASGERWIYMDPANGLIRAVQGRKYRAGVWVWQWNAPNGYGGNPRIYWEGFNPDKSGGTFISPSAQSPEATKAYYENISDGSFQCYASDLYIDYNPGDQPGKTWVRPRINLDNLKPSSGYQISGWFFREVTDDVRTNARVSDEATTRANQDGALANRISTTEAQLNGAQGSTLLSRITDETTARVNQDSALANRASALEVRGAFSGGNLVPQTSFTDLSGWTYGSYGMTWDNRVINGAGDTWHPIGENVLTIHELGRGSDDAYFDHAIDGKIAVDSNNFYQFYAYVAAHRAKVAIYVVWRDENDNFIANTYLGDYDTGGGGRDLKNWSIIGNMSVRPPANAASAQLHVRKRVTNSGEGDSWMWFCRPYFGRARENQNEWNAFTHGSNAPLANSTRARIATEETARANADSAIAGRVSTIEAQFRGDQDSTIAARIRDEATTRANQDGALAGRISTTEAQFTRTPQQFRVTSRGAQASNAPFGETRLTTPDGSVWWTGGRSYLVIVFDPNSNNVGYANTFDVFGGAAESMAALLNGIGLGQTVIIATNDEPQNNRFNSGLDSAMARVGAGEAFFSSGFKYRSAYVLVGQAGIGRGNGVEFYKGDSDNDPNAFIDKYIPMLNGKAVLGSNSGTTQLRAAISEEANVRANADGALSSRISSVEATANGASSTASVALSAAQDAKTMLGQARIRLKADAGNGRAQVDIYSDSLGSAAVDMTGDVRILGQNGGYSLELASQKGFTMKNSQGQAFIELGIFG